MATLPQDNLVRSSAHAEGMGASAPMDVEQGSWGGGTRPVKISYGKMMMWYFIISDALTFTGFLIAYGFMRFKFEGSWPVAEEVFTHFPFLHGDHPLLYVALMTFILIVSSVTMVLAVDAGHQMNKTSVVRYMFLTIIGGLVFLLSQAWEWSHFIHGEYGGVKLPSKEIVHIVDAEGHKVGIRDLVLKSVVRSDAEGVISPVMISEAMDKHGDLNLRMRDGKLIERRSEIRKILSEGSLVEGANLKENEYGRSLFGDMFFFITGFHGFHVFTGVVINIIIFINVLLGTYEKRKSYEMVEKVGLYWHFVDLVWVFVFTFFYLV